MGKMVSPFAVVDRQYSRLSGGFVIASNYLISNTLNCVCVFSTCMFYS